jgi:hypothetical protein
MNEEEQRSVFSSSPKFKTPDSVRTNGSTWSLTCVDEICGGKASEFPCAATKGFPPNDNCHPFRDATKEGGNFSRQQHVFFGAFCVVFQSLFHLGGLGTKVKCSDVHRKTVNANGMEK